MDARFLAIVASVTLAACGDTERSLPDTQPARYPVGNYQALLWNKTTVVLSIKDDGTFRMRFTKDDGTLTGRLVGEGGKWVLRYDSARGPVGEHCFPERSILVRTALDELQGECKLGNETLPRTFTRMK